MLTELKMGITQVLRFGQAVFPLKVYEFKDWSQLMDINIKKCLDHDGSDLICEFNPYTGS
jgi:hypothetical protein